MDAVTEAGGVKRLMMMLVLVALVTSVSQA